MEEILIIDTRKSLHFHPLACLPACLPSQPTEFSGSMNESSQSFLDGTPLRVLFHSGSLIECF